MEICCLAGIIIGIILGVISGIGQLTKQAEDDEIRRLTLRGCKKITLSYLQS